VAQNASGFIGSLSRLHVWNRVLPGEEIEEMAIRPSNYVGNVIDWYKLAAYVAGDVEVMKPSSALHTGWFNHKNCYPSRLSVRTIHSSHLSVEYVKLF
jgi:hypothetical protein